MIARVLSIDNQSSLPLGGVDNLGHWRKVGMNSSSFFSQKKAQSSQHWQKISSESFNGICSNPKIPKPYLKLLTSIRKKFKKVQRFVDQLLKRTLFRKSFGRGNPRIGCVKLAQIWRLKSESIKRCKRNICTL